MKVRTRICSMVPAVTVNGKGPRPGTRLAGAAPPLSSAAMRVNVASVDPVNTASTVSKLLPFVFMKSVGAEMVNEHGAVHVHHRLGVPVPRPILSVGSPGSVVAPVKLAVAVSPTSPVNWNRFANASFDGKVTYANRVGRVTVADEGLLTCTSTTPGACAPVVATSVVELRMVTFVAGTPPIDTDAPATKP